jgi:hypothetical protein
MTTRGALVDRCDRCGALLVRMRPDQHAAVEAVYQDLSWQVDHPRVPGLKLEPWQWHQLMLFAFAKEKGWDPTLVPSLDGAGLVMLVRNKQSRLTKRQGSELIEFVKSEAVKMGAEIREWDEAGNLIAGRSPERLAA